LANLDIRPAPIGDVDADSFTPGASGVWVDFNFGVGALTRGSAAPDLITIGSTSIETLGFDGVNTLEEVSAVAEMNHNWREGTIIKPHVHWLPSTNDTGNVHWQLEYVIIQDDAVAGAGRTIEVIQAAAETAWTQQFASFPDIVTTGLAIGAQIFFRLFRDPTDEDTYGADAAVATFGLHVQVDTLGSRQVGVK